MSMRTFLLLVFAGKTDLDYWVEAIVNRGIYYTRDDLLGLCKFAGTPDRVLVPAFQDLYGVEMTQEDMMHATQHTYLCGLLLERQQGATLHDDVLPSRVYERNAHPQLPRFITPSSGKHCGSACFRLLMSRLPPMGCPLLPSVQKAYVRRHVQPVLAPHTGQNGIHHNDLGVFLLGRIKDTILIERFDIGEGGDCGHCLGI